MFIAVPVGMNYRTERWPVVTLSLIGVNTLVRLVTLIYSFNTDGASDLWVMQHLWLTPAEGVWFTYFTSMFVHAGFVHLAGNMIYLFLFGCCVEDMIGRWWYLLFYLVGGLVAELAFIASTPLHFASDVPLGGASGAISACMGMYLLLRANADIDFKYFYFIWLIRVMAGSGEFSVPAWMAVGFWFLSDLFWMVLGIVLGGGAAAGGTAFGAHVGGLLTGLGLIWIFLRFRKQQEAEETSTDILSPAEIKAAARVNEVSPGEVPTIYLHENGAQSGPFTLAEVQERLTRNEVAAGTLYWCEGMAEWEGVEMLKD
jgi:membrane associated rhomboid family serine protease